MKRVLLLACDPGGANVVASLFHSLKGKGFDTELWGRGCALGRYKIMGLSSFDLNNVLSNFNFREIDVFIRDKKPDLVITGTSAQDFTERYVCGICKLLKIPCFVVLDQWVNYGIRFSKYRLSEIGLYNADKNFEFLPSKIFVMDEYSKARMIAEGIDSKLITVTGHPYLDWLQSIFLFNLKLSKSRFNLFDSTKIDYVICFISEPIEQIFKDFFGYTEKTILSVLLDVLSNIALKRRLKFGVLIKQHSRENLDNYDNFLKDKKFENIKIKVDREFEFFNLINSIDLVCGMTSMALIESFILKKRVISIQIGLKQENFFILDKLNLLKSVLNIDELTLRIESLITDKDYVQHDFKFVKNAIENILMEVENFLCN